MRLALVCALLATTLAPERAPSASPMLVIRAAVAPPDTSADDARGASLSLAVLSPSDRHALAQGFERLLERLRYRQNPYTEDLEEGDPQDEILSLMRAHAPLLGAASSFASESLATTDGAVIRVADHCEPGARCFSAWSAPTDPDARRARLFMWPVTMSATIAIDDASFERVREALRAASADPTSPIAFAAGASDLLATADPDSDAIRRDAWRTLQLVDQKTRTSNHGKMLRALSRAPESGPLVPWLHPGEHQLLIMPRLTSVTRIESFNAEISRLANGSFRWIHRPTPL